MNISDLKNEIQLKNLETGNIVTVYPFDVGECELYFYYESDRKSAEDNIYEGIDQLDYVDDRDNYIVTEDEYNEMDQENKDQVDAIVLKGGY